MELKEEVAVDDQKVETNDHKEAEKDDHEVEDDEDDDGVVWNTDVSAEAIRQRAQVELNLF